MPETLGCGALFGCGIGKRVRERQTKRSRRRTSARRRPGREEQRELAALGVLGAESQHQRGPRPHVRGWRQRAPVEHLRPRTEQGPHSAVVR